MYFLIDPVYKPEDYLDFAKEIDAAYRGEGAVAVANLIKPAPGSDVPLGGKMFIREDGLTEGTLVDSVMD